ncbi:hypothetical protein [Delftia lacustris]|uniref:hypothetical protein n=1 Tax=Delftia lacustris TaxID=558537 RepID=UPI00064083D2|nr:hypothetical protein [Delftia lacustris]
MALPGYTPAVKQADDAMRAARAAIMAALEGDFPKGCQVRVHHGRGSFEATVVGWIAYGEPRIKLRHNRTGRHFRRGAEYVEALAAQAAAKGRNDAID